MKHEFDFERIKESAEKLGLTVRKCGPGEVGGLYVRSSDGTRRELTMSDMFPEWEEDG
ncbi:hypothetical protein [Bacillus amyloliquefaciens]|uniref:hypothetical protein n=1 Tax=Bacillus amyloliquefaciens TaxID=1390 RepID=UPI0022803D9F|nr:hypothetical protein [Bacillus amyloliquefaciens]MCY7423473.1 hypothetical protein [Bacillus amyloliquefaciens]MEC0966076.1 hypothetical protein [Bacillus amyloliquefaciens]MEC1013025.1 hypothetical protein [Bacillus amyloliquefaciens]